MGELLQFLCSHRHQAGSALRSQHRDSRCLSQLAKHWDSAAGGSMGSSRLIFQVEENKQIMIFQVTEPVPVMFKGELFWHSTNPARENVKSYLEISGTRGRTCCMEDLCSGLSRGITCQLDCLPSVVWQPIGGKEVTAIEGSSIFLSGYLLSGFPVKAGLHYQKLEAPQSA